MKDNIIWTCTYCHRIPSAQSSRKCQYCGRKLTPWDPSKAPLERKPEWTPAKNDSRESVYKDDSHIDYTAFFNKKEEDRYS